MSSRKRSPEQNEQRRLRANYIKRLTGDSILANKARDWSNSTFNEYVRDVNKSWLLPEKPRKQNVIKKSKKSIAKVVRLERSSFLDLGQIKQTQFASTYDRYKATRKALRAAGYTPSEANKLKSKKITYLQDLITSNKVFIREDRINRWTSMSKKGQKLDPYLRDLAEQINIDNGFDDDSRYGFGVVFAWYINGGEVQDYIVNIDPDLQLPDIYYGMDKFYKKRIK